MPDLAEPVAENLQEPVPAEASTLPAWSEVRDQWMGQFPELPEAHVRGTYEGIREFADWRSRTANSEERTGSWLYRRMIPVASAQLNFRNASRADAARQRLASGQTQEGDAEMLAVNTRQRELDQNMGWGGQVGSALASIPAIAGEAYLTGGAASAVRGAAGLGQAASWGGRFLQGAVVAPAMPSLYVERAIENNRAEGRANTDWRGFPAPVALAAIQNGVFSSVGSLATGVSGAGARGAIERGFVRTVEGMAIQQGMDIGTSGIDDVAHHVFGQSLGLHTHYGTIGEFVHAAATGRGDDWKQAFGNLATQAITFAAFAAMHAGERRPETGVEPALGGSEGLPGLGGPGEPGPGRPPAGELGGETRAPFNPEGLINASRDYLNALHTETRGNTRSAKLRADAVFGSIQSIIADANSRQMSPEGVRHILLNQFPRGPERAYATAFADTYAHVYQSRAPQPPPEAPKPAEATQTAPETPGAATEPARAQESTGNVSRRTEPAPEVKAAADAHQVGQPETAGSQWSAEYRRLRGEGKTHDQASALANALTEGGQHWQHTGTEFRDRPDGKFEITGSDKKTYTVEHKVYEPGTPLGGKDGGLRVAVVDSKGAEKAVAIFDRKPDGTFSGHVDNMGGPKGLGRAMYDYVHQGFGDVRPTSGVLGQTAAGKAFWQRNAEGRSAMHDAPAAELPPVTKEQLAALGKPLGLTGKAMQEQIAKGNKGIIAAVQRAFGGEGPAEARKPFEGYTNAPVEEPVARPKHSVAAMRSAFGLIDRIDRTGAMPLRVTPELQALGKDLGVNVSSSMRPQEAVAKITDAFWSHPHAEAIAALTQLGQQARLNRSRAIPGEKSLAPMTPTQEMHADHVMNYRLKKLAYLLDQQGAGPEYAVSLARTLIGTERMAKERGVDLHTILKDKLPDLAAAIEKPELHNLIEAAREVIANVKESLATGGKLGLTEQDIYRQLAEVRGQPVVVPAASQQDAGQAGPPQTAQGSSEAVGGTVPHIQPAAVPVGSSPDAGASLGIPRATEARLTDLLKRNRLHDAQTMVDRMKELHGDVPVSNLWTRLKKQWKRAAKLGIDRTAPELKGLPGDMVTKIIEQVKENGKVSLLDRCVMAEQLGDPTGYDQTWKIDQAIDNVRNQLGKSTLEMSSNRGHNRQQLADRANYYEQQQLLQELRQEAGYLGDSPEVQETLRRGEADGVSQANGEVERGDAWEGDEWDHGGEASFDVAHPGGPVSPDNGGGPTSPADRRTSVGDAVGEFLRDESGHLDLNRIREITDDIKSFLAPASRGPHAATMAGIAREAFARLKRKNAIAREALKKGKQFFDQYILNAPDDATRQQRFLAFTDAIEGGNIASLPLDQRVIAQSIRDMLDTREQQLRSRGLLKTFVDNYFGHLWKDPKRNLSADQIGSFLGARRPLAGRESYRKERVIPTYADGIAAGLEPVSWNPVELALLKMREIDKSIMGRDIFEEASRNGLTQYVRLGNRAPEGWIPLEDKLGKAFAPHPQGIVQTGNYYMPEPAAKLLHNYLKPGLYGRSAVYDIVREFSNLMNQFQLGFSAFHLGFVTMDTQVSAVAQAVQRMSRGDFGKQTMKNLFQGAIPLAAPISRYLEGSRVLSEYYKPNSQGAEMMAMVEQAMKGGAQPEMDRFYGGDQIEKFKEMLRSVKAGNLTGVPLLMYRSMNAFVELISKPVMEHIVPRMKAGVIADGIRYEMERIGHQATTAEQQAAIGRVVDSVDNRLGQLAYDNLFWSRTLKDILMVAVRSVGWNVGTWREVAGGVKDIPQSAKEVIAGRGITPRTAYIIALPMVAALYGAIYQMLATGKPPEEPKDYFFPKTGRRRADGSEDRVSLPSYMRDVATVMNRADEGPLRVVHNTWLMGRHKINPGAATVIEMLNNETFRGVAIYNPNDRATQQARDIAMHMIGSFQPFVARTGTQNQPPGQWSGSQAVQGFFGITPAPSNVVHSWQQQRMNEADHRYQASPLQRLHQQRLR